MSGKFNRFCLFVCFQKKTSHGTANKDRNLFWDSWWENTWMSTLTVDSKHEVRQTWTGSIAEVHGIFRGMNIKVSKWNSGDAFCTVQFSETFGVASMWRSKDAANWVGGQYPVIQCRTMLMMPKSGLSGLVHHIDMTHVVCLYDTTQWHVEIIAKLTEAVVCFLSIFSAHSWLTIFLSKYYHGSATPSCKDSLRISAYYFVWELPKRYKISNR